MSYNPSSFGFQGPGKKLTNQEVVETQVTPDYVPDLEDGTRNQERGWLLIIGGLVAAIVIFLAMRNGWLK